MSLERKIAGLSLILLMLTYDFHGIIVVFASTRGWSFGYATAGNGGDIEFLRRQLENAAPPEGLLLERGYVVPNGVNLSLVVDYARLFFHRAS